MTGGTGSAGAAGGEAESQVTVAEAIAAIDRATAFTEPLRRRTEGVTIALWGFVTACMLLSNALLDDVYGFYHAGGWKRIVSSLLWVPWAALGVVATMAVWRIAEVSTRVAKRPRPPAGLVAWFAVLVAVVAGIAFLPVAGAAVAIGVLGIIWLSIGALDLYRATPVGRRTLVGVGLFVLAAAAVYATLLHGATQAEAWRHFEAAAVLAAGLVPIVAGLRLTLRG